MLPRMFFTLAGSAPFAPEVLGREIARRTGLADLPPQIEHLPAPAMVTGGDGYVVASRDFVGRLRALDPNVVAFAAGEGFLVTSIQEIGTSMLLDDDSVTHHPHPTFRIPSWGQRTFFAGEVARFVGEFAPLVQAGRFVAPRRWRTPR